MNEEFLSVMSDDVDVQFLPVELDSVSDDMITVGGEYDVVSARNKLVRRYYKSHPNLLTKITSHPDGSGARTILNAVIEEMVNESDHLLGNELLFTNDGALHDATTVSVKRTEVLSSLSTVALKKVELDKLTNSVDLNSPAFQIFQQICVDNLRSTLKELSYDNEMIQVVLVKWGEQMSNWDKELKSRLANSNGKS